MASKKQLSCASSLSRLQPTSTSSQISLTTAASRADEDAINMCRNAANIAALHLHPITTTTIATRIISRQLLLSAGPTVTAARSSQLSRRSLIDSGFARSFHRFQHVAAKDTPLLPAGPTAIAPRVGLGAAARWSRPVAQSESVYQQTARRWSVQRRAYSDYKSPSEQLRATQRNARDTRSVSEDAKATSEAGADNKGILDRIHHMHRPTKEELLAAATGFWHRLTIRFKWFSIRSVRPFTLDEIGAFASWIFLGHVIWIVIGTTTFMSLAIWALNTVFAQETLAGWVGNYLTKSSGLKVVFESAIVPTWRSGVITFNNVFVSRRPGQHAKRERSVSKGSSTTAAAAAEAAMAARDATPNGLDEGDDGNYSQFDVTIQTVNVTLSFSKWFNGKGPLQDVEILGVRGVIDRTHIKPSEEYVDPKSYRHEHNTGDFEIDDFKMSDVLLTVHQPGNFRPFTVSVFNCELPRLRKQWLFYDFMSANNMSGSFDESLFTVHPRQVHGTTGVTLSPGGREDEAGGQWKKHSRLRIDGLNIDHLNRGVEGPFGWIYEGNVDIVADVMIPHDDDGVWRQSWRKSAEVIEKLYDTVEASVTQQPSSSSSSSSSSSPHNTTDTTTNAAQVDEHDRPVILDIRCHLNDVRARVPLFATDLGYVNNALVRPIVAYINSRQHGSFIPVNCRVVKTQSEFDGSWTIFDSGLLEDLSKEVYDAFARDVEDSGARKRRMRKVGWWGVQVVAQALFIGLAGQLA